MSLDRDVDPRPELSAARTRGVSPRVAALVIGVVLGSVVIIGISGRGSPAATPPALAVLASPARTGVVAAETPQVQVHPSSAPDGPLPVGGAAEPTFQLVMQLTVGDVSDLTPLDEVTAGHFTASSRVNLPTVAEAATIDVARTEQDISQPISYGSWPMKLGIFHGGVSQDSVIEAFAPTVLIEADQGPEATDDPFAPDLAHQGFHIRVTGQRDGDEELLTADIKIAAPVNERYAVIAHVGKLAFPGQLYSVDPGRVSAQVIFPGSVLAKHATIELTAIRSDDPSRFATTVGTFAVVLPKAGGYPVGGTALNKAVDPSTDPASGMAIETNGYRIAATYALVRDVRAIIVVVEVNPDY